MKPQSVHFYYYTGTGNTLNLVRYMTVLAEKRGIPTNKRSVDRLKKADMDKPSEGILTGICYPTHGFNAPWHIIKFVCRMPKSKGARVFLLNSRGGAKLRNWRLPGLSGIALLLPALILFLRGFSIRGLGSADPPSNWISLHPGWNQNQARYIFERAYKQTKRYFDVLLNGKRIMRPMLILSLPLDLAVSFISVLYLIKGRFVLAKMYIPTSGCTSCALCQNSCPVGAIKMIAKKPYWTFNCESCMRCINICPEQCIQTSHSFLILIIAVFAGFGLTLFVHNAINLDEALQGLNNNFVLFFIIFAIDWVIYMLTAFLLYFIMHVLIRIKPFRLLFEFTALSRYWKRYMSPDIKSFDLKPQKSNQ